MVAALLCAVASFLRRRQQRPRRLRADVIHSALPPLPVALVDAVRSHNSVVVLGAHAILPSSTLGLDDLLRSVIGHIVQAGVSDAAVEDIKGRLSGPDLPLAEAELLLGDLCAAVGRERVRRSTNAVLRKHGSARQQTAASALAARQLAAVASVPFTAAVVDAWSVELEAHLPHRVGRNFGGFAAVLARPRVDTPPSRARPVLQLWPGLLGDRGVHSCEGPESLPTSRSATEQVLAEDSPYLSFLRDLLLSKTALLAGWELPPRGHLGAALRWTRRLARARGASGAEPLAYALVPGGRAETSNDLLEEYGLCVLSYNASTLGDTGLEECFRALADSCRSGGAAA